jgi:tRNA pseudouridine13 synthase
VPRAKAILDRLRRIGVPNFFGPQRFGIEGDNAERARAFVSGKERAPRDRRLQDLLVSALQSEIFNKVLERRIDSGAYARALKGDVMQKHETGGLFVCTEPAVDQLRVDALEISPCGPLPGKKTKATEEDAAALEGAVMTELGFAPGTLDRWADGTRRVMRYPLDPEHRVVERDAASFELEVSLPSGAYATVLLDEVIKPAEGRFDRSVGDSDG